MVLSRTRKPFQAKLPSQPSPLVKPDQEALSSQASEPTKIPPSPGDVKPDQEALSSQASEPTKIPPSPGGVKPDQEALSKAPPSPGAEERGVKPNQEALSSKAAQAEESKEHPNSPKTPLASNGTTPASTPATTPRQAVVATQDAPGDTFQTDQTQAHDAPEVLSFPPQQLSEGAIDKRLRRVMSPRANGEHLVSGEFVKLWQDRVNGRDKIRALFEKAAYCPETR